jgi:hypothetical protein
MHNGTKNLLMITIDYIFEDVLHKKLYEIHYILKS